MQTTWMKKAIAGGVIGLSALGATAVVPTLVDDAQAQEQPSDAEREARRAERQANREARKAQRVAVLTEALGIGEQALADAREAGLSVAQIAEAEGVPVADVVDAIVAAKTEAIQERVTAGDITQEEANEKISGLAESVTERVERTPGERGDGEGRRGFGRRGGPPAADA